MRRLLDSDATRGAVREAMIALSDGRVRQQLRSFIGLGEGRTFADQAAGRRQPAGRPRRREGRRFRGLSGGAAALCRQLRRRPPARAAEPPTRPVRLAALPGALPERPLRGGREPDAEGRGRRRRHRLRRQAYRCARRRHRPAQGPRPGSDPRRHGPRVVRRRQEPAAAPPEELHDRRRRDPARLGADPGGSARGPERRPRPDARSRRRSSPSAPTAPACGWRPSGRTRWTRRASSTR